VTRIRPIGFVLLGLAGIGGTLPAAAPTPRPTPTITVSKETTYFVGPLKTDGTVDYAAALNRLYGEGVTPENNAAVVLLPAFGAALLKVRPDAASVAARIGARPLPAAGEFLSMIDYAARVPKAPDGKAVTMADVLRDAVRDAPWSEGDHPLAAGWLRANERALARIVEASARPRYWLPLTEGEDIGRQGSALHLLRETAIALASRAMRKMSANDLMRAWDDLQAGARLAGLVAQGPLQPDWFGAFAIRAPVDEGIGGFATHASLTPEQARTVLADLERLPAVAGGAAMIDRGGRLEVLATVTAIAQDPTGLDVLDIPSPVAARVDWDAVLRALNRRFDRLAAAARVTDAAARRRAVAAWMADVGAATAKAKTVLQAAASAKTPAGNAADLRAPEVSEAVAMMMGQLDSTGRLLTVDDFARTARDINRLAMALAVYRSENGGFPATLSSLVPGYLKAVPTDSYGPRPFAYEHKGGGYLLYSVGANGKPDQAAGATHGDDIVRRVNGHGQSSLISSPSSTSAPSTAYTKNPGGPLTSR
jgi:hypothetical protein